MARLILMVGLPGAGKTTLAKKIGGILCSVDDCPGRYIYDQNGVVTGYNADIPAHVYCQVQTELAMKRGCYTIIVDNTSLKFEHRQFYKELSKKYKYRFLICWVGDGGCSNETLAQRGVHKVPLDVIRGMRDILNS